jgi:protein-arginine kinase activator protein McsA
MKIKDIYEPLREKHPDLKEVYELKYKYIKEQKYEKAAAARDLEKQLIEKYTKQDTEKTSI